MAAGQLRRAFENGVRCRNIAVGKELLQCARGDGSRNRGMLGQPCQFTGECKEAGSCGVVQRFLAETIPGQKQTTSYSIENGEREHAINPRRQLFAPFLPAVHQHFSVRMIRSKAVAAALEIGPELGVIIDFAVENDADLAVLVPHRLMARGEVNDRQPPMAEKDMRWPHRQKSRRYPARDAPARRPCARDPASTRRPRTRRSRTCPMNSSRNSATFARCRP